MLCRTKFCAYLVIREEVWQGVKVIMHYPQTEQGRRELKKKIASVHTEAVVQYLTKLPYPKEQKLALLQAIRDDLDNGK